MINADKLKNRTPSETAMRYGIPAARSDNTIDPNWLTNMNLTWTTPAFSASDFTASDFMTWTVDAGDVTRFRYAIIGKLMIVLFALDNTTIGGTPSNELYIKIPESKICVGRTATWIFISNNGSTSSGFAIVSASGTKISIRKDTGSSNFTASSNDNIVWGQITFEIQ